EQAMNTKHADQRSDLYSLGCTLYYLLTGRAMYSGETAMEKLMAHQTQPTPPLPNAPPQLQAVYQRMVAKQPDQRYQSMLALIADLAAISASGGCQPPGVGGDWTATEAFEEITLEQPAPSGRRWVLAGCSGVGALLLGGCAIIGLIAGLARSPDSRGAATQKIEERETTGKESRPDQVAVNPPSAPGEIDLLKVIDPARHAVAGKWRLDGT